VLNGYPVVIFYVGLAILLAGVFIPPILTLGAMVAGSMILLGVCAGLKASMQ
jgi:hypothetical protein